VTYQLLMLWLDINLAFVALKLIALPQGLAPTNTAAGLRAFESVSHTTRGAADQRAYVTNHTN
jgi:hypothetical protein